MGKDENHKRFCIFLEQVKEKEVGKERIKGRREIYSGLNWMYSYNSCNSKKKEPYIAIGSFFFLIQYEIFDQTEMIGQ